MTSSPGDRPIEPPDRVIEEAISWLRTDASRRRQMMRPRTGPSAGAPGRLLEQAHKELAFDQLLDGSRTAHLRQDLIQAQADWLHRHLPDDHQPVALDSAQQAGRAWGVLIAADHFVLPDPDALAAVIDRDGISPTAARELRDQAELTGTALQRAHELSPYDGAPESLLVADWRQLAACGPELPDAATAAYEVLEQLAARTVSDDDHAWMDSSHARDTARLVAALAGTDPLLAPLTQLLTSPEQPYPDVRQARLREPDLRHRVMLAATAYARVHSVLTSPTRAGGHPIGDRRTAVEIAAPAVRTLQGFNAALSTLTTDQGAAPAEMELDHSQLRSLVRKFTDLAEAVRSLSHGANATQRSQAGPAEHRPGQHPAQDATTRPRRPAP